MTLATGARVILRNALPNALASMSVSATFEISGAILVESSLKLSLLRIGPIHGCGDILSQACSYIDFAWWHILFSSLSQHTTVWLSDSGMARIRD
jgi:ABC-type dipeptide/oligopeptide/nickel transport system permease subunit